jgi:flagellar basal-body rod protein FlgG
MLDAIYSSLSALHSQQVRLDITSNNLANVNTGAFKKKRATFSELVYPQTTDRATAFNASIPERTRITGGFGTYIQQIRSDFVSGDLNQTGRTLDVAIQGTGFFEVEKTDGSLLYTRHGSLTVNSEGELVSATGLPLSDGIRVPTDATAIAIGKDGLVLASVPDEAQPIELGQIMLANFTNAEGLETAGDGLFRATDQSGQAFKLIPGESGLGLLQQGFLEASNVDFVEEMVELSMAQRAYQLNARVLQAADEMLAEVNGLRR